MAKPSKTSPQTPVMLEVRCPADSACLIGLRGLVTSLAQASGFNEEQVEHIEIAVDEACANAIDHAYEHDNKGEATFHVRILLTKEFLEIAVIDHGKGCPEISDIGHSMEEFNRRGGTGGLGTFIIRRLMDEVHYERPAPSGTSVRMRKYLRPEANRPTA